MSYTLNIDAQKEHHSVDAGGIRVDFAKAEDGGYTVEIPDFPGCASFGETLDEARENIVEAAAAWMETKLMWLMRNQGSAEVAYA